MKLITVRGTHARAGSSVSLAHVSVRRHSRGSEGPCQTVAAPVVTVLSTLDQPDAETRGGRQSCAVGGVRSRTLSKNKLATHSTAAHALRQERHRNFFICFLPFFFTCFFYFVSLFFFFPRFPSSSFPFLSFHSLLYLLVVLSISVSSLCRGVLLALFSVISLASHSGSPCDGSPP